MLGEPSRLLIHSEMDEDYDVIYTAPLGATWQQLVLDGAVSAVTG